MKTARVSKRIFGIHDKDDDLLIDPFVRAQSKSDCEGDIIITLIPVAKGV
jgi:hypothetical protein